MTNDGWGSDWYNPKDKVEVIILVKQIWISQDGIHEIPTLDKPILYKVSKDFTHSTTLHKESSNLIDDEQKLYFQCSGCNTLFDPDTKSFKTLHDKAKEQGWKVKWNEGGQGYNIYCRECKE